MNPSKARLVAALLMLGVWLFARSEGARATPFILRHQAPVAQDGGVR